MSSTAGDFRNLTPLVLMSALQQAGTDGVRADAPLPAGDPGRHARRRAAGPGPAARRPADAGDCAGASYVLEGEIPAARVHELNQQLPALTRGEGVLESAFDRYQPVRRRSRHARAPTTTRLNRREYVCAAWFDREPDEEPRK